MKNAHEGVNRYKGRPLFDNLHKINQTSLLSHKALEIDMKGFFNLLVIIIFSINFRLVLENFKKYGLIIKFPTNFIDADKNVPLLICFINMHISIIFSWFIERHVAAWLYCLPNNNMNNTVSKKSDRLSKKVGIKKEKGEKKMDDSKEKREKKESEEGHSSYEFLQQIYEFSDTNIHLKNLGNDHSSIWKIQKTDEETETKEERKKEQEMELIRDGEIQRDANKNGNENYIGRNNNVNSRIRTDNSKSNDSKKTVVKENENCNQLLRQRKQMNNKKWVKKIQSKKLTQMHGWKYFHLSIFILKLINSAIILVYPFLTVTYYNTEPTFSTTLLCISIVWFFKFYSFHHVCADIRKMYIENENLSDMQNINEELKYIKKYPYCLTLKNYYLFILMPTMCFQFCYPRTKKIRWLHVFKHVVEVLLLTAMIKIISDQYIFVTVRNTFTMKEFQSANFIIKVTHIIERMLKLSIPTLYIWLIGFLIIFHHWCNILAEITKFGDRLFYNDWWNASSFGEYWRKWNLPIHYFVNRHINKPLIYKGLNRNISAAVVFFISALLHEYIISIPLKMGWTGFIFLTFIFQIPLVHLTNHDFFKKHKTIGNTIFWVVFCFTGQPLSLFIYYYLWQVKKGNGSF